jgi:hypothetical protein
MAAGLLLVGWIAVQLPVIRTFSWLQPICALLGLAVLVLGKSDTLQTELPERLEAAA